MFKKKRVTKRLARIKINSAIITEQEALALKVIKVGVVFKKAENYTPSTYYTEWKDKTQEERDAEGVRLFEEACKNGIPIESTEVVVDMEMFLNYVPTLRFEYIGPVYANL